MIPKLIAAARAAPRPRSAVYRGRAGAPGALEHRYTGGKSAIDDRVCRLPLVPSYNYGRSQVGALTLPLLQLLAPNKGHRAMTPCSARSLYAMLTATVLVGFAAALVGCASLGPVVPVAVSDIHSIRGHWTGTMYRPRGSDVMAPAESVELTIREDGTYPL